MADMEEWETVLVAVCDECSAAMTKAGDVTIRECQKCLAAACEHGITTEGGSDYCIGGCSQ